MDSITEQLDFLRHRIIDFGLELTEDEVRALEEARQALQRGGLNLGR